MIISHIMDWLSIFFYQGSIFYTQSQFFLAENECEQQAKSLYYWFLLEIITFYGLIFSAIIYLILAAIFSVRGGMLIDMSQKDKIDFITWSKN
jgi:hypothetical protein